MKSLYKDPFAIAVLNAFLGIRAFLKGLDYFRFIEYVILFQAFDKFNIRKGKILDIGCGEEPLPLYLVSKKTFSVIALDIDRKKIQLQKHYAKKVARKSNNKLNCDFLLGDAEHIQLKDDSVDAVICLALLLLLPGDKDKLIMKEVKRVLRPGGYAFISISYGRIYGEFNNDVVAKGFSRIYDAKAIQERISGPSGLREVDCVFFEDRLIPFSKWWYRLPFLLRLPFRWCCPLLSLSFLKHGRTLRSADGVMLILRKPEV